MSIILFILVLVALIVVHEFGHFVAAKLSKMRVDEFGIGYPPRIWGFKKGETEYTLNWLPFGGFVRIFGEDASAVAEDPKDAKRAFYGKPKILQALVLIAGIAMNLLFAWVLLSITLAIGAPRALTLEEAQSILDSRVAITSVLPGTPAQDAGLKPGDTIVRAEAAGAVFEGFDSEAFTVFVGSKQSGEPITFTLDRGGKTEMLVATPRAGVISDEPTRPGLGVAVATVGTVQTPLWQAPIEGAQITWEATKQTTVGLAHFFGGIFTLSADLAQVSGPIGIAGAVGDASDSGLAQLLTLTAIISINLALINIIPLPALDGGRLLFVLIETITRRPIPMGFARALNATGFALLLLLMVVVTASDLFKIVS